MNTYIECLPCLGRNAVDIAGRSTEDQEERQKIVTDAMRLLAEIDFQTPPPHTARQILNIGQKYTGERDIYHDEKIRSNQLAERLLLELPQIPQYDPQNFESRLRLAVAGNILDFGIYSDLDIELARNVVCQAFNKPLDQKAVSRLHKRMDEAKSILYILDNCGEAVFDRVFMEPYREKIILGVRGRPAFNDVTKADLKDCGLLNFTRDVVSNGSLGVPGSILSESSEEFCCIFRSVDLIVAKGQGNFETMDEYSEPIAFLFLAKCPVVLRRINAEQHSIQVRTINF